MKLCLFIVFLACQAAMAQQPPFSKDSADFYFSKIDNNAMRPIHGHFGLEGMNHASKILYNNANKYVIDKLIDSLNSPGKTLVCHVLLTLLIDSADNLLYHSSEDMTEKIFFLYKYNGFSWKNAFDKMNLTTELQIDSSDVKNIKAYWISAKKSLRYIQAAKQ